MLSSWRWRPFWPSPCHARAVPSHPSPRCAVGSEGGRCQHGHPVAGGRDRWSDHRGPALRSDGQMRNRDWATAAARTPTNHACRLRGTQCPLRRAPVSAPHPCSRHRTLTPNHGVEAGDVEAERHHGRGSISSVSALVGGAGCARHLAPVAGPIDRQSFPRTRSRCPRPLRAGPSRSRSSGAPTRSCRRTGLGRRRRSGQRPANAARQDVGPRSEPPALVTRATSSHGRTRSAWRLTTQKHDAAGGSTEQRAPNDARRPRPRPTPERHLVMRCERVASRRASRARARRRCG